MGGHLGAIRLRAVGVHWDVDDGLDVGGRNIIDKLDEHRKHDVGWQQHLNKQHLDPLDRSPVVGHHDTVVEL